MQGTRKQLFFFLIYLYFLIFHISTVLPLAWQIHTRLFTASANFGIIFANSESAIKNGTKSYCTNRMKARPNVVCGQTHKGPTNPSIPLSPRRMQILATRLGIFYRGNNQHSLPRGSPIARILHLFTAALARCPRGGGNKALLLFSPWRVQTSNPPAVSGLSGPWRSQLVLQLLLGECS